MYNHIHPIFVRNSYYMTLFKDLTNLFGNDISNSALKDTKKENLKFLQGFIINEIFMKQERMYGTPVSRQYIINHLETIAQNDMLDMNHQLGMVFSHDFTGLIELRKHTLTVISPMIENNWCETKMDALLSQLPADYFDDK